MDGDGSNRASPARFNPVPQIPAEYDDLNMQLGAGGGSFATQRDFSQDINKKMKMPNRLSVDGQNLHELEVENMRANNSSSQMSTAGMAIPEKITLSGSGHRGVMDDHYNSGFMNTSSNTGYVNMTTPPRVLTVDERFPLIEEESVTPKATGGISKDTANRIRTMDLDLTPQRLAGPGGALAEYSEGGVTPPLILLERRLQQLEQRENQRQTRDMVVYPVLGIYLVYKILNWFMSR